MQNYETIVVLIMGLAALISGLSFIDTRHMNELQSNIAQNKVLLKSALGALLDLEKEVKDLKKEIKELKDKQ